MVSGLLVLGSKAVVWRYGVGDVGNAWRRSMSRLTECRHHDPCISLFSDHASILAAKNNPIHHTASSTSRATHDGPNAASTYLRSYSLRASPRASAAYRACSIELNPRSEAGRCPLQGTMPHVCDWGQKRRWQAAYFMLCP